MYRRHLLGTTVVVAASVAGCGELLGEGDDSSNTDGAGDLPTSTDTPDESEIPGDGEVGQHLQSASDEAMAALGLVETATHDLDEGEPPDLDRETVDEHLSAARADIETVRENSLTDEQIAAVESLDRFVRFVELLADVLTTIGEALESYAEGGDHLGQAAYWDAWEALEWSMDRVGQASRILSNARDQLDEVDFDALDWVDGFDGSEIEALLSEIDGVIVQLDVLLPGVEKKVEGMIQYEQGVELLEGGEPGSNEAASERFELAAGHFDEGIELMEEGLDRVPSNRRGAIETAMCDNERLRDATEAYAEASMAYHEGRQSDGDDHVEAAEAALEREC